MFIARNLIKFHLSKFINSKNAAATRNVHIAPSLMAGHSKWANIKHIKAQKDGQKAAHFTRMARQIRLAIQEGGSADPALNSTLRSIIDNALRHNMPMATIQNNIKKSQQSKTELKRHRIDIRYKQKVFAICAVYTDNFAGAKMEISPIVKKAGGILVDVGHMFEDFGLVEAKYDLTKLADGQNLEELVTEDAIECGAEEVEVINATDGIINFICSPTHLNGLSRTLESKGYLVDNTEHMYTPNNVVQLTEDERKAYDIFVRKLRDVPGLEEIYDNVELSES